MARPGLLVLLALAAAPAGCASLANQPPTPARDIPPGPPGAVPGERYFLLVFGSESRPKRAKYTHSWATMVRVVEDPGGGEPAVEPHTISWLPTSLDIRPLSFRVEPGANFDLASTLDEMFRQNEHVSVWGPYEVGPRLFERFLVQKAFLETSRVGYQCVDSVGEAARTGGGCDCIHAVTDMDPLYARDRYPLAYFGEAGSRHLVRQFHTRPAIIHPGECHDWLLPRLGLDRYPVERQTWNGRVVENTPENVERYLNSPRVRRQMAR
jgi:hypothetical protein